MEALDAEANRLLESSLAKSTHVTYSRGVSNFMKFRSIQGLPDLWPAPQQHVIGFIAQMSLEGKAAATINTYISAIAYIHKINGWWDPAGNFIIRKLREGCKRQNNHVDSRRPVTILVLQRLLLSLPAICSSSYESYLFRSAFSLAFFGFMRVGEFTVTSIKGDWAHILLPSDVSFSEDQSMLSLSIRSSKTDQRGKGVVLQLERQQNVAICPVKALIEFLGVRPSCQGPLFVHFGGDPLTRFQFSQMLKKGIQVIGLPPENFSPHSFRIGAATSAALCGITTEQIMAMGRWRSAAVNSYIRPSRVIIPGSWTL